jgi:AcrR family transcriptional regulator
MEGKTRELSKQETREALIRAGMTVFDEQGVDLPSLDSICARAGFTRGAFYVHFKDRDDFLAAVLDRVISDFVQSVIASGGTADDLAQTIDRFLATAATGKLPLSGQHRLVAHLMSRGVQRAEKMRNRYRAMLEGAIALLAQAARAGQAAGRVGTQAPPEMVAGILVALALGLIQLIDAGVRIDTDALRRAARKLLQITDPP